jgi:gp32 DNA binding protein like
MDLSALKSRLAALQNPRGGQKGELAKTLWSPAVGKHQVRIVPSMYNKSNPFKELFFHYGIGNKNTMISLSNFGEKDPIVEFAQGLRKSSVKEDWQMAKKLEPKMRVYAPVIVRGQEELGVVLWGFGKQVYMDLLALVEDEDVGDFTDPVQGRDITIDVQGKETTGLSYNTSSIRVRTKITPLSEDAAKVKQWLTTQPDPMTQFKKYSYEEMKSALMSHLNPEEEIKQNADSVVVKADEVSDLPWEAKSAPAAPHFSLSTTKKDVDSKIDDLFNF